MQLALIFVVGISLLNSIMTVFLMFRFKLNKGGLVIWVLKSYTAALSSYLCIVGIGCLISGLFLHSAAAELLGVYSSVFYFVYIRRIVLSGVSRDFRTVFGVDIMHRIPQWRSALFLRSYLDLRNRRPIGHVLRQNIPFPTVPGTGRHLLCDLWLPSPETSLSGLAFIYLHGGAWYHMDKDLFTRPFFKHLTSQGHVVMDVAYRMYPETDMSGMIQDAKRAIGWMKDNAANYGVDRNKIVIGGGSAGGHIALMAAYLHNPPAFIPAELAGQDLSVKAVASIYGPSDLKALYYHTGQNITTISMAGKNAAPVVMPDLVSKIMGKKYYRLGFNKPLAAAGSLPVMLGCHPDECPELYTYFSPLSHVSEECPATLLIQGEHDMFTPVSATRELYKKLTMAGVPSVMHLVPQTDHGFDLFMPGHSLPAHIVWYDIERFLAIMAMDK
jgi:acetyl esterase/lipase